MDTFTLADLPDVLNSLIALEEEEAKRKAVEAERKKAERRERNRIRAKERRKLVKLGEW